MPYVTRAHIHTSSKHLKSSVVELNKNAFSDPVADMETDLDQALKQNGKKLLTDTVPLSDGRFLSLLAECNERKKGDRKKKRE
jgi:hypothetical protein